MLKSFIIKNLLSLSALLLAFSLSAQDEINIQNGCNFVGDETETNYYSFEPSNEADKIVRKILAGTGVSFESIVLKEANVKNALASTVNKRRYILYSTAFLEKFKSDSKSTWAAYTVLAHEIGHHVNGHDFAEKDPKERRKMELQADRFAGSVCRTLGATLEQALAGMESMELEGETATHPPKSARTAAVANGWKTKDELLASQNPEAKPPVVESKPPSPTKFDPADGTVTKWVAENQKPQIPSTTYVTIAYAGDLYSCNLTLAMSIGGMEFIPLSNSFLVQNIPTGLQQYAILGSIDCGMNGSCTAIGYGQINVVQGGTYNIQWNNSGYAECTVVLR